MWGECWTSVDITTLILSDHFVSVLTEGSSFDATICKAGGSTVLSFQKSERGMWL
jgi:hypothetical protein